MCTTVMTTDEFEPPEKLKECVKILYEKRPPALHVTVNHSDGSVTKEAIGLPHQKPIFASTVRFLPIRLDFSYHRKMLSGYMH